MALGGKQTRVLGGELPAQQSNVVRVSVDDDDLPPRSAPGELRVYLNPDGSAYASANAGPVVWGVDVERATNAAYEAVPSAGRWHDLTTEDQERVKRLLTPDPEDSLDDLLARMNRAQQIIRGERP